LDTQQAEQECNAGIPTPGLIDYTGGTKNITAVPSQSVKSEGEAHGARTHFAGCISALGVLAKSTMMITARRNQSVQTGQDERLFDKRMEECTHR
jgi:hypothetical protein